MPRLLTVAQVAELLGATAGHGSEEAPDLLHSGWYSTDEVAELLGVDPSTLRRWRTASPPQGPPFVRLTAREVRYSVPDVQAWLVSCRVDPGKAA